MKMRSTTFCGREPPSPRAAPRGGYLLNSVTAKFRAKVGNPAGFKAALATLNNSGQPDTELALLTGSAPDTAGDHTFSCSGAGCQLQGNTTYFLYFAADTSPRGSDNHYVLETTTASDETQTPPNNGWSIANSAKAQSWTYGNPGEPKAYDTWKIYKSSSNPTPALFSVDATERTLTASAIGTTTATLTVGGHPGGWYYNRTAPTAGTCSTQQSGTTASLTGLTAGTSYTYKTYSDSSCTTEILAAKFVTQLAQVTGVTLTTATATTATVSWTAVTGATDYKVQWKSGTEEWDAANRQTTVTATTATLTSLASNTTYTVRVQASNASGDGAWSATSTFLTTPDQVTGVTLKPLKQSLAVSWMPLAGTVTGYKVQWKSGSEEYNATRQETVSSGTTTTITGLADSTTYTVRVTATNATGDGPASADVTGTTWGAVALSSSAVETSTATLTITSHIESWYYKESKSIGSRDCIGVAAGTTTVNLTGLQGGTSYTYKAYSDSLCSTELTSGTTDEEFLTKPGQVTGVQLAAGNAQLDVSWATLAGTVTGYKVQWKSGSEEYNATRQETVSSGTTTTITGLASSTAYTVRVTATNATGDGPASADVTGTPLGDSLVASAVEHDTATLTIANYTGDWYYKNIAPAGGACSAVVSSGTTTANLTGLAGNTSYTFKAYSDSNCTTELDATAEDQFLTKPGKPSQPVVSAGGGSGILQVLATLSGSGTPLIKWQLTYDDGVTWSDVSDTDNSLDTTVTGLDNGTSYVFKVRAVNASGAGPASDASTARDPSNIIFATSDATTTSLKLTVANHSGNWYYKYTTPSGGQCSSLVAGSTAVASGLQSSTSYIFKVYSDSGCTTELAAAPAFFTKPVQVSGVAVAVGNTRLAVSWTAVTGTVAGYKVQWKSGNQNYDATRQKTVTSGTATVLTGLANGTTYTVRVLASNASGDGAASTEGTATPVAATLTVSAVADDTATLSISSTHTGNWYTKYTVPTGGACSAVVSSGTTTTSYTGLAAATSYTFNAYSDSGCTAELAAVAVLTRPAQVGGVTLTEGNGLLDVSWTALPGTISGYKVQWKSGNEEYNATRQETVTSGTTATITGLLNGTTYTVRVTAYNGTGDGAPTPAVTGSPALVSLSATAVEHHTATLSIASHGSTWYYQYTAPAGGACSAVVSGGVTTANLTGLAGNTSYTFNVYRDSSCTTELNTTEARFLTKPGKPSQPVASAGAGSGTLRLWATLSGGSTPLSKWQVSRDDGATWSDVSDTDTTLNTTVTALDDGTSYTFKVRAVNATGTGPASAASIARQASTVTLAAENVTHNGVTLTLGNHDNDWYYKYTVPTGGSCSAVVAAGATATNLAGLTPATRYLYNAYSDGACATELAGVEFLTSPGQVSGVVVTEWNGSLNVRWNAMAGTVSGYKVQWKSGNQSYDTTRQQLVTSGTSTTITGLTNATVHTVRVTATNATGDGAASTEKTGTPAVKSLSVSAVEADTATLTIAGHTGDWYYKATSSMGSRCSGVVRAGTTTAGLTGLAGNTSYTVKAYGDSGCTAELTDTRTQTQFLTKPGKPSRPVTSAGAGSGILRVVATLSGGSTPLSKWQVTRDDGATWSDVSDTDNSLNTTVTALDDGTSYTFKVRAERHGRRSRLRRLRRQDSVRHRPGDKGRQRHP